MNKQELTVYVLARTDLPSLNPGKLAAQVHHAGVQMMAKYGNHPLVKAYLEEGARGGADNFNTTIVLGATWQQMDCVQFAAGDSLGSCEFLCDKVMDPSYPFVVTREVGSLLDRNHPGLVPVKDLDSVNQLWVREETTALWFLGDRADPNFTRMFQGLELYP